MKCVKLLTVVKAWMVKNALIMLVNAYAVLWVFKMKMRWVCVKVCSSVDTWLVVMLKIVMSKTVLWDAWPQECAKTIAITNMKAQLKSAMNHASVWSCAVKVMMNVKQVACPTWERKLSGDNQNS